jgi:phospholipid/cholesterol/gamma-HCH transport system substrate-binding protein
MDWHYRREAAVGGIVLLAAAGFILGTMWLGGRDFSGNDLVNAKFSNVGNLKKGSAVTVSGVPVGRVEEVYLRGVGDVVVAMRVPERVRLQADAHAQIQAVGLVGDMAVRLAPGDSPDPLPPGTEIPGNMETGLAELGGELSARAGRVLEGAELFVSRDNAELLARTLASTERLTRTLADPRFAPTAELTQALDALERVLSRLDRAMSDTTTRRTLARMDSVSLHLDTLAINAASATSRLDTLLANVNQGRGTLGKLASDSSLYQDLRETNRALQRLLDELGKEPGKLNVQVKMF